MNMRRSWIVCALLLGCLSGSLRARAQSPESVIGGEQHLSVGGDINATYLDYGKRWIGGAGVSVDAGVNRWLGLEGEANYTFYRVLANTHATTYLGGLRYQFRGYGRDYRIRPYAKFLAGAGEFNFPYNYAHGNYFVMAPGAGLEKWISNDNIHIRVVDVEYQVWPQFTFGTMKPYGISTGISFRVW